VAQLNVDPGNCYAFLRTCNFLFRTTLWLSVLYIAPKSWQGKDFRSHALTVLPVHAGIRPSHTIWVYICPQVSIDANHTALFWRVTYHSHEDMTNCWFTRAQLPYPRLRAFNALTRPHGKHALTSTYVTIMCFGVATQVHGYRTRQTMFHIRTIHINTR